MNRDDVRMIERRGGLRLLHEAAAAVLVRDAVGGSTLMATSRSSRGSRARYTSPMPPAPISESTSYGPSFEPEAASPLCALRRWEFSRTDSDVGGHQRRDVADTQGC